MLGRANRTQGQPGGSQSPNGEHFELQNGKMKVIAYKLLNKTNIYGFTPMRETERGRLGEGKIPPYVRSH